MELAYDLYIPPGDVEINLPPVIFLHGMFDSRKTWKFIAPEVAKQTGRRVYTLDARNHGGSPWNDNMSFDILADDVDNFLSLHNIRKAVLAGHSMGGRTALTLALRKPEKVEKLVVEDMSLKSFRPVQGGIFINLIQALQASLDVIPRRADEMSAKKAIASYFMSFLPEGQGGLQTSYDLSMMPLKQENGKYSWQANLNAIQDMLTTNKIQQTLNGIYMGDALFLYGTKSFFKVDKDPMISHFFPRAVKIGFDKATHLVHFEFTSRFISEVSNFINDKHLKSKY